jgi:hypothetical protein
MTQIVTGWQEDPWRRHELRYFSFGGLATRLVCDLGKTSFDPPPTQHECPSPDLIATGPADAGLPLAPSPVPEADPPASFTVRTLANSPNLRTLPLRNPNARHSSIPVIRPRPTQSPGDSSGSWRTATPKEPRAAWIAPAPLANPDVPRRFRRASPGRGLTWLFLLYNVLMLAWVIAGTWWPHRTIACVHQRGDGACSGATRSMTTIPIGILLVVWVTGALFLVVVWLATKRRSCLVCGRGVAQGSSECQNCRRDVQTDRRRLA